MSLRILFADDSMTAQNMGKKILSEAGYDVVAVSNGAAAVKKIAEQKPDIIILDVYMPGYTGLEVCEKVRGSLDTLKTPVLLTVGKMEPYKPEDANRVKADGVIIKPFEASDLLAIVKKFEERIGSAPPPMVQPAVVAASSYTEEAADAPLETQTPSNRANMQPMVEVPDHMASSAAFGDMLGSEPASAPSPSHFAVNTPSAAFETSVIVPAPPLAVADETAAVERIEEQAETVLATPVQPSAEAVMPEMDASPEVTVMPVEAEPLPHPAQNRYGMGAAEPEAEAAQQEPAAPENISQSQAEAAAAPAATDSPHAHFIPVFKEPGAHAAYDLMPTAVPAVDDVEIPREPALQESAEEATRNTVADQVEPGLMSTIEQPVEAQQAAAAEVSDADFEARVAAAMAAYSHATEAEPAHAQTAEESAPAAETHEVSADHAAAAEIPSFEYQPAAGHAPPAAEIAPDKAAADANADHAAVEADMASAIPEAAAAAAAADSGSTPERANPARSGDPGADHHTIAQAIHRVMERLKPELVEEIMKELRTKK